MKIIHATTQRPELISGGGLGIFQSCASLSGNDVTYFGPELIDSSMRAMYSDVRSLDIPQGKISKALRFAFTGSWHSKGWDQSASLIEEKKPDCAYLDFTLARPFSEAAASAGVPLVVRAHNVEFDYSVRQFAISKNFRTAASRVHVYANETRVLECADAVICLTEHDRDRFLDLYSDKIPNLKSKMFINPVCLREDSGRISDKSVFGDPPVLLITGSLWYGANANGVVWFINEVWPRVAGNFRLIVAGANPSDSVLKACNTDQRIELVASPKDMAPYFNRADIFVAPVFDGAGMKVKVAEALSYGLPVVATSHALLGYVQGVNCLRQCDNPEQMAEQIESITQSDFAVLRDEALDVFHKNYSMESSRERVRQVLEKVYDARQY